MPLAYRLDPSHALVTITGDYSEADEWRRLLTEVLADPRYQPGSAFLRDLRTSIHPVDVGSVVAIVDVVREFWPKLRTRRAAMLTRPGVDFPAVVAHALAEDQNLPLRAFDSYDDAMRWLKGE